MTDTTWTTPVMEELDVAAGTEGVPVDDNFGAGEGDDFSAS